MGFSLPYKRFYSTKKRKDQNTKRNWSCNKKGLRQGGALTESDYVLDNGRGQARPYMPEKKKGRTAVRPYRIIE